MLVWISKNFDKKKTKPLKIDRQMLMGFGNIFR
jgi:hypothetical protein